MLRCEIASCPQSLTACPDLSLESLFKGIMKHKLAILHTLVAWNELVVDYLTALLHLLEFNGVVQLHLVIVEISEGPTVDPWEELSHAALPR